MFCVWDVKRVWEEEEEEEQEEANVLWSSLHKEVVVLSWCFLVNDVEIVWEEEAEAEEEEEEEEEEEASVLIFFT